MIIVTNTAPINNGLAPSLGESKCGGRGKFDGGFDVIPEGMSKVAAVDFRDVFLTSKSLDLVVSVEVYTSFFKEADIEV